MRAVLCSAFTGAEDLRIGEIEEPKPASDEILIDVHAASVSFMDHLLVLGSYQMRSSTPFVPGTEAAGIVIAVMLVTSLPTFSPIPREGPEGYKVHGRSVWRSSPRANARPSLFRAVLSDAN